MQKQKEVIPLRLTILRMKELNTMINIWESVLKEGFLKALPEKL
jgi:hypothetical protein